VTFVGVDLGWKVEPKEKSTAICAIDDTGELLELEMVTSDEEILNRVFDQGPAWVGIDAPLLVPNHSGMRRCERMMLAMGLHALPSNTRFMDRKYGGRHGEVLANRLNREGFSPASPGSWQDRMVFEVYPHGSLWVLTHGHVPSYKRGRFQAKASASREVVGALEAWDAPPELVSRLRSEIQAARPSEMKGVADLIDSALAVMCLYHHRLSRGRTTQLVGEEEHGFVLLPAMRSKG